jgi:hypothetical protein
MLSPKPFILNTFEYNEDVSSEGMLFCLHRKTSSIPSLLPAKFHFQNCHHRLVLRMLGLIANNNKRIPTTSKTNPRLLMLCVFIIMVSCPSCDHASQPPTIANTALKIRFIFTFLNSLNMNDLTKKFWIHRLTISRIATSHSFWPLPGSVVS